MGSCFIIIIDLISKDHLRALKQFSKKKKKNKAHKNKTKKANAS